MEEKIVCPICGADDHEYLLISRINGEIICCSECIENEMVRREWTI